MSRATPPAATPLWKRMLLRRLKFIAWLAALLLLVFGGSYLFAPQWLMQANVKRQMMAAQLDRHSVQVGDTHWVYDEGGQGPTIVLLHGFASDKEVWLKVAKQLTAHFHVLMPDLPGWGESSRDAHASYNIDAQAARLHGFVQGLHLQRFVLVGHGTGGAIAAAYASDHPAHVAELVLLDAFGLKGPQTAFDVSPGSGASPFLFDDRAGFKRASAQLFAQPRDLLPRFVDVLVKRNVKDHAFIERVLAELRQPGQALALQQRLKRLTMPVLGVWCHDDKVIDRAALDNLRNGLTAASAISSTTINGCNHMPMMEMPDVTAQILTRFALSH